MEQESWKKPFRGTVRLRDGVSWQGHCEVYCDASGTFMGVAIAPDYSTNFAGTFIPWDLVYDMVAHEEGTPGRYPSQEVVGPGGTHSSTTAANPRPNYPTAEYAKKPVIAAGAQPASDSRVAILDERQRFRLLRALQLNGKSSHRGQVLEEGDAHQLIEAATELLFQRAPSHAADERAANTTGSSTGGPWSVPAIDELARTATEMPRLDPMRVPREANELAAAEIDEQIRLRMESWNYHLEKARLADQDVRRWREVKEARAQLARPYPAIYAVRSSASSPVPKKEAVAGDDRR
jgi:hypothetical protein